MKIWELRKMLKEKSDLRVVVRVRVSLGSVTSARLEISRTAATRLLRGSHADNEAVAALQEGWLWIG